MFARPTLLILLVACATSPTIVPEARGEEVEWRSFSDEVFETARREGKLVLLDVGIEGCTACRWMLEGTYSDPEVARRVNANFIPVAVDANANPELGARYVRWAWPATIILAPDGDQVLALRGNKRPRNFLPLLDEALRRAAESTRGEETRQTHHDETHGETNEPQECAQLLAWASSREQARGGWSAGPMFMTSGRLVDATLGTARDHALRTTEQYAELLDSEWGGLYMALRNGAPIYEKRMPQQAHGLLAFAHAYAATGDETWLQHAANIDRYVARFLLDEGGGFYAAQRDVPPHGEQNAEHYFAGSDAERVAAGIPLVDRGIYAAIMAQGVEAYAELARLSAVELYGARAIAGGRALLAQVHEGRVAQLAGTPAGDGRLRERVNAPDYIVLETQARTGLALLALFDLTQDETLLRTAGEIAERTRALLHAREGGFYSAPPLASLAQERRALDNALFARLLFGLSDRTHELSYLDDAAEALTAAKGAAGPRPHAALVAELLLADGAGRGGIIDVSIAGDEDTPAAQQLLNAARSVYSADRRAHFDRLERYPRESQPAAYVCTRSACSPPLRDVASLRAALYREVEAARCEEADRP